MPSRFPPVLLGPPTSACSPIASWRHRYACRLRAVIELCCSSQCSRPPPTKSADYSSSVFQTLCVGREPIAFCPQVSLSSDLLRAVMVLVFAAPAVERESSFCRRDVRGRVAKNWLYIFNLLFVH